LSRRDGIILCRKLRDFGLLRLEDYAGRDLLIKRIRCPPREREAARRLLSGESRKIVATGIDIFAAAVSFRARDLYRRLNIQSRTELFVLLMMSQ